MAAAAIMLTAYHLLPTTSSLISIEAERRPQRWPQTRRSAASGTARASPSPHAELQGGAPLESGPASVRGRGGRVGSDRGGEGRGAGGPGGPGAAAGSRV